MCCHCSVLLSLSRCVVNISTCCCCTTFLMTVTSTLVSHETSPLLPFTHMNDSQSRWTSTLQLPTEFTSWFRIFNALPCLTHDDSVIITDETQITAQNPGWLVIGAIVTLASCSTHSKLETQVDFVLSTIETQNLHYRRQQLPTEL